MKYETGILLSVFCYGPRGDMPQFLKKSNHLEMNVSKDNKTIY
jgi:hypothetical protein